MIYSKFEEIIYTLFEEIIESGKQIIIREQETTNTDTLAIELCKENPEIFILERYKIQWDIYNKSAGYVNLKFLLQGRESEFPSLLLLSFSDKWDKMSDKKMIDILIDDFNSSVTFMNSIPPYMFKNVYQYKS